MAFNRFLEKALRSPDLAITIPAHVVAAGAKFADNVVGVSAVKMRAKAKVLSRVASHPDNKSNRYLQRLSQKTSVRSEALTTKSHRARMLTGLGGVGGVALHKRNQGLQENAYQDYSQYAQY